MIFLLCSLDSAYDTLVELFFAPFGGDFSCDKLLVPVGDVMDPMVEHKDHTEKERSLLW